ncbi:MAG: SPASM domain-containing protein [Alphaproteobacteria bacterium]|nr:SPASM domain-containing protein [Alphaproteobacteria bacterium]
MAPRKIYDAVVRHENSGPVIWSHAHGKYFIANDDETAAKLTAALKDIETGHLLLADKYDRDLIMDLEGLGVTGVTRTLISPFSDRLSAPLEIYFDYTWVCNLAKKKCGLDSYCYAREFLGKQTMEQDTVRSVMQDLADWGVMRIHLAGGEPTSLREDLGNYLQAAYDCGQVTSMATNGILMNRKMAETILDRDIFSVSFSFDGHDEESYAAVRGKDLFVKALQGFKLFKSVRDEYRTAGMGNTEVSIKPTFTPYTPKAVLRGLVDMAIDLGADSLKFANPERCLYHDKGYYRRIRDDYYAMGQYILELQEQFRGQIKITGINNPLLGGVQEIGLPRTKVCIGGQELLTINPDGKITPCLMHNADLGNLHDFPNLKEAWEKSAKLQAFRQSLVEAEKCSSCDLHSGCRSGSTTRKIVEKGKFNETRTSGVFSQMADPLCPSDYLKDHPEAKINMTKPGSPFVNFKPVIVTHSL